MKYDYDMAVLGGGAAGLTAAGMSASFGADTVLIEGNKLGGDCTWYGCVPSKTLLKAARVAYRSAHAGQYGLQDFKTDFDTTTVFNHIRTIRQSVYEEADQPSIYEKMGISVEKGFARFCDRHTIAIEDEGKTKTISSRYIIIATGSRTTVPPISGLEEVGYLTNETIFELDKAPQRLIIIGSGAVGTEMAQAFQRLGTGVTVIESESHILSKDDPELTDILRKKLAADGVRFVLGGHVFQADRTGESVRVHFTTNERQQSAEADAILVATGRQPRLTNLDLEAAGVQTNDRGVIIDKHCRTSVKNIYACGDITGRYMLTHMSEHTAKVAAINALLKLPYSIDEKHVTWVTYCDPELAHVGMTRNQLEEQNISYKRYRFPYNKLDRAITENETTGWIYVYAKEKSGRILGVDILGERAGDMISEYALAMKNGVSLRKIADTIHPYPTYGLGVRRAADQWYVQRQSTGLIKIIQKLFGYRGALPDISDKDRIV